MERNEQITLEEQIHDLLCGELDEFDRAELLWRIGTDDHARRTMTEMIHLQRQVRRAFGLEVDAEWVRDRLEKTLDVLRAKGLLDSAEPLPSRAGPGSSVVL